MSTTRAPDERQASVEPDLDPATQARIDAYVARMLAKARPLDPQEIAIIRALLWD